MCPVHDNPLAQFAVTLWRDSEVFDAVVARDGFRAAAFAKALIDAAMPLQHGDRLTVTDLEGNRREPFHDLPADDRFSEFPGEGA